MSYNDHVNSRQQRILDILGDQDRVAVKNLANELGVSNLTIRRDLESLEKLGLVLRDHGGAMPASRLKFMKSFDPGDKVTAAKVAIGAAAARMVSPGQTIMIDSGTTAYQMALHLPQNESISVATVSLCVAEALYGSAVDVFLIGGNLRKDFPSLVGPATENMLSEYRVDTLFIGCDSMNSETGFYDADVTVSSLVQAMIRIANHVVIISESVKFSRTAFVRFASLNDIDALVTDSGISPEDLANLENAGVEVIIADKN